MNDIETSKDFLFIFEEVLLSLLSLFSPEETTTSRYSGGVCKPYSQLETSPYCQIQQASPGLWGISSRNSSQNGTNGSGSHDLRCELNSYHYWKKFVCRDFFSIYDSKQRKFFVSFFHCKTFLEDPFVYFYFRPVCLFSTRHGRKFKTMYKPGFSFSMQHAGLQDSHVCALGMVLLS